MLWCKCHLGCSVGDVACRVSDFVVGLLGCAFIAALVVGVLMELG